ncbi:MAG TPA: rRNA maturation RNase YbeY [Candidatus Coatesbacteria bacterium]|nr:rRNA maturation RNase YbeY [Candidatus Coatesbacteria bacterium]
MRNYEVLVHDHQKVAWLDPELPRRAAVLTLTLQGTSPSRPNEALPPSKSIAVVLFDDRQMARLNETYAGSSEPTDVLAFDLGSDDVNSSGEGLEEPELLGDVFVNVEAAVRQAGELGHSLGREVAILVSHGVLHLLGYIDSDERGRQEMAARAELVADHEWLAAYTK